VVGREAAAATVDSFTVRGLDNRRTKEYNDMCVSMGIPAYVEE
jgi:hypothetical protein